MRNAIGQLSTPEWNDINLLINVTFNDMKRGQFLFFLLS